MRAGRELATERHAKETGPMEAHDNKQLALQKALSAHEQAAAATTDLMGELPQDRYLTMLERIDQNVAVLKEQMGISRPGDHV